MKTHIKRNGMPARDFFARSPMYDSIEVVKVELPLVTDEAKGQEDGSRQTIIEIHPHICCICNEQFPCTQPCCGILDKYAVCSKAACQAWENEVEDEEVHSMGCVCEDCAAGDYDPHRESYPAR